MEIISAPTSNSTILLLLLGIGIIFGIIFGLGWWITKQRNKKNNF